MDRRRVRAPTDPQIVASALGSVCGFVTSVGARSQEARRERRVGGHVDVHYYFSLYAQFLLLQCKNVLDTVWQPYKATTVKHIQRFEEQSGA